MPNNIPTNPVQSSNILEIGHCPITNRMVVKFNGGGKYCYHDVNKDIYEKVKSAESVGNALHTHIKKSGKDFTKL